MNKPSLEFCDQFFKFAGKNSSLDELGLCRLIQPVYQNNHKVLPKNHLVCTSLQSIPHNQNVQTCLSLAVYDFNIIPSHKVRNYSSLNA